MWAVFQKPKLVPVLRQPSKGRLSVSLVMGWIKIFVLSSVFSSRPKSIVLVESRRTSL